MRNSDPARNLEFRHAPRSVPNPNTLQLFPWPELKPEHFLTVDLYDISLHWLGTARSALPEFNAEAVCFSILHNAAHVRTSENSRGPESTCGV
jgi:hypothetical protein